MTARGGAACEGARDDSLLAGFPLSEPAQRARLSEMARESARMLRGRLPGGEPPATLVTLGSGLGDLAGRIEGAIEVPYADVPHMRASSAPGHAGRFVAGTLLGRRVICMQGRLHPYEGLTPLQVTYPLRVCAELGVRELIVTNATGAINGSFHPGQVVNISDHVNLTGTNPLIGANDDAQGPRFPDMTHAYSPRLGDIAREAARAAGYRLEDGVYLGVSGPAFETPAEIRAYRALGADLVGMSTVWEVILAAYLGIEVLGLSLVTNMAAGMLDAPISVDEIDRHAREGARDMAAIVSGVMARL
ncbi:MAG: purine-nucleoside phosphorylase [Coriobacteriales bacterium]|jgi:purine-nucleoside phosphorylase